MLDFNIVSQKIVKTRARDRTGGGGPDRNASHLPDPFDIERRYSRDVRLMRNGQFDRATLDAETPDIIVDSFEDADHLFQALEV